jgi:sugar diacid utilization regulator
MMRLNLYVIEDYLSNYPVSGHSYCSPTYTCGLDDVGIYRPGEILQADIVYLLTPSSEIKPGYGEGGTYILLSGSGGKVSDMKSFKSLPEKSNYLVLDTMDVLGVLFSVQKIFRTFREWEQKLYQMVSSDAPLKAIGASALPFLYNPICMDTASLRNVFLCERSKPANLRIFVEGEEGQYEDEATIEAFRLDPDFRRSVDQTEPAIFPSDIMGYRILYYNICVQGVYICRLMALEVDRPFRNSDAALIKILAGFIKLAMQRKNINLDNHPKHFEESLVNLIHGIMPDEAVLNTALEQYGWSSTGNFLCLVLPVPENDKELHTVSTLMTKLENLFHGSVLIRNGSELIMVIDLAIAKLSRDEFLSQLIYIIRENFLKAGVSLAFEDLKHLKDYYQQARSACELGQKYDPMIWCYRYEQYEMADLLTIISSQYRPESLYPHGLRRLISYDRQHHTQFTRSLKAYLENDTHIKATIQELYIQRATFLYQLKRITEITGFNLNDKKVRQKLRLIFQLVHFIHDAK